MIVIEFQSSDGAAWDHERPCPSVDIVHMDENTAYFFHLMCDQERKPQRDRVPRNKLTMVAGMVDSKTACDYN